METITINLEHLVGKVEIKVDRCCQCNHSQEHLEKLSSYLEKQIKEAILPTIETLSKSIASALRENNTAQKEHD